MEHDSTAQVPYAVAAKAFIVKDGKVLMLMRSRYTKHKPGQWDVPGGRLEPGEDPYTGLRRETMEEANMEIDIVAPLNIDYFKREDGQQITMIIFLCKAKSDKVTLSEEHTEYKWADLGAKDLPEWMEGLVARYTKYFSDR